MKQVIRFFLLFIASYANQGWACESGLALVPVHQGSLTQWRGQAAHKLGQGGTASVYRIADSGRPSRLIKDYLDRGTRDQDVRGQYVWKDMEKKLALNFLSVVEGIPVGDQQIEYPDIQGTSLHALLGQADLDPAVRRRLRQQYERLYQQVENLFAGRLGEYGPPAGVSWQYEEKGSTAGLPFFISYYADHRFGSLIEGTIMLKPENIIVTPDMKFVISDPY